MKITAIRGKNLASLADEFEIDFTKEPLASAGIFAITGNTGSGKSTILDAICLALYDCTPRTNRAKETSVALNDVSNKTISQNDTRSILRRGTAEGYAQVDFVASTGEKYRATWSVRRAGNKPSGALQKVEMNVLNLNSGEPLQGTKTEIQSRIVQLVGLSFQQFSRSVLLAQGDFATFLVAKVNDKAEILEKLTGTEIYSFISTAIYDKAKEVDLKKKLLLQKISDVELMDEECKQKLYEEKDNKLKELDEKCAAELKCRQSIDWLDEYRKIVKGMEDANKEAVTLKHSIDEAAPRYRQVAVIEAAQGVRDVYVRHTMAKKQLEEDERNLEKVKGDLVSGEKTLKEKSLQKEKIEKEKNDYDTYLEKINPDIEQAKKLDIKISEQIKRIDDASAERKKLEDLLEKDLRRLKMQSDNLTSLNEKKQKLDEWFKHYDAYSSLVPAKDLVVSLLTDYNNSVSQINSINRSLNDVDKNQQLYEKNLESVKSEVERLDALQPSEVIVLRKKLQYGVPCPVCGSIDHPYAECSQEESLKQEELEKLKTTNKEELDRLTAAINRLSIEKAQLSASILNHEKLRGESEIKVERYVSIIPQWNDLMKNGGLKDNILKFCSMWNSKSQEVVENKESIVAAQATIDGMHNEIATLKGQLKEKIDLCNALNDDSSKLKTQRKELLEGKSTSEIEQSILDKKKELADNMNEASTSEHSVKLKIENVKARIEQASSAVAKDRSAIDETCDKMSVWLSSQSKIESLDELDDIFSKDEEWLSTEKEYLSSLKEKCAVAIAVMEERKNKLKEQEELAARPTDDHDLEYFQNGLSLALQEKNAINVALAQIDVRFKTDKDNREKVEKYKKEYESKEELFQAWTNLNDLFGSKSGDKFKGIAQEYTLDILLMYANNHLKELAPRYQLERVADSLALQIVDLDMMGEKRSVHSLSGGESFLVSLALALGLSSISSNRMNVESLFIDEGFGSLDVDTLRTSMDALECLQMQGKKIGVISHITDMTERISTRIQVNKYGNGRSVIEIL